MPCRLRLKVSDGSDTTSLTRPARRRAQLFPKSIVATLTLMSLLMLAGAPVAHAACGDVEYSGAANGSWQTGGNWTGGSVPKTTQSVCIPAGKGIIVVPAGFTADAKTVLDESGMQIESTGKLAIADSKGELATASRFADLTITSGGTLSSAGGWIKTTGTVSVNGVLEASSSVRLVLSAGTLSGTGTIQALLFNEAGTVQPGGVASVGTLHLEGEFSQSEKGRTVIDLAGDASSDLITMAGPHDALLVGGIEANVLGVYSPAVGTSWQFISGGAGVTNFGWIVTPTYFKASEFPPPGASLELKEPIPPKEKPKEQPKGGGTGNPPPNGEAPTPQTTEEVLLGCTKQALVLNDVYIHGSRVALLGSAAKTLAGQKVRILFNEKKQVATATVGANGQFSTTAPLPPKKIRDALTTRYTAAIGSVRSLHVKLTRRLLLEPPSASGTTVTLTGTVTPPLTKPVAPIVVEERLQCAKTLIAARVTPPKSGRFKITVTVPAGTKAALYQLKSTVAANPHSTKHGFTTFSLQLPVALG